MANNEKPFVKNAADPEQVKAAGERVKSLREREANDIIAVCSTSEGRRLLWRIMSRCKVFESVWSPSAQIHYNSGMQDVGHFLMAEVVGADPEILLQMIKENRKQE